MAILDRRVQIHMTTLFAKDSHCYKTARIFPIDVNNHHTYPIRQSDSVSFEAFVTWTGRSSMEVFVKVITKDLKTGYRRIAATSFLTFVAVDENNKPIPVPQVIPQTEEEKKLYETAEVRAASPIFSCVSPMCYSLKLSILVQKYHVDDTSLANSNKFYCIMKYFYKIIRKKMSHTFFNDQLTMDS